jgi:hypothetical protein
MESANLRARKLKLPPTPHGFARFATITVPELAAGYCGIAATIGNNHSQPRWGILAVFCGGAPGA